MSVSSPVHVNVVHQQDDWFFHRKLVVNDFGKVGQPFIKKIHASGKEKRN